MTLALIRLVCEAGRYAARYLAFATALFVLACGAPVPGEDDELQEEQEPLTTPVYQINCGGGALSPFTGDQFASGGSTWTENVSVSTSGVSNAAPAGVYQSERYGNYSYTFGSLTPAASYTVRLHFAETKWTTVGTRVFNVVINGSQVLSNFDIFAAAGLNKALVRDFTATASGSGQIVVQYVTIKDNAKSSGIEILSTSGTGNQAPTVATAAAANPNPTTSTTTALSVLGADDGGESNLTYTWAPVGTPPAAVSFSANGTNAAKNATATFTKAGSYTLGATIRDTSGATVTSNVSVTVNQKLTSITVSPSGAQVTTGGSQSFVTVAKDQFGSAMSTQPSVTWSVSGGGSINSSGLFTAGSSSGGPFTVSATSGTVSGSASVTVTTSGSTGSPVYQINCGGGALSPFSGDQFASGGNTWTDGVSVSTSGVANAAPAAVYQSERYGNYSYTFGSLTPNANYTVRLHFAENKWTTVGTRVFNVVINGSQVLSNFDIFAAAGLSKALVRDFTAAASGSGQIVVQYVTVKDNAKSSGIEIISTSGGPGNQAPTVASAAAASPNPTSGNTSALSVLGADDGGESNLTYSWATVGTPPAAVSFSTSGTNAAKNVTATFTKAGNYTLGATIRDAGGATVTSNVNVTVNQKLTSISVSPTSAQVTTGGTQQFFATAKDQFYSAMSPQPSIAWSVSAGGTISPMGLFSAGGSSGGPFTVSASSGGVTGTASVAVTSGAVSYVTDFNLTESPISEGGAWKQLGVDWTRVVTANGYAYGTQSGSGGFNDSYTYLSGTYPPNQSASAIIHLESGVSATYAEVEILLRWVDSAHNSTGYECNLAFNGQYAEIIRWPGPLGTQSSQFTWVSSGNPVAGGVHDGDVFQADIIGNVITSRLNGQVIATGTDNAIASGSPGMGFYWQGGPATQKFSFTHFSATGL